MGSVWKNAEIYGEISHSSGRLSLDWGNNVQAEMPRLGSLGLKWCINDTLVSYAVFYSKEIEEC